MKKTGGILFTILITLLAIIAASFIVSDLVSRFTGLSVGDTYLEELKLEDCIDAGKWDQEMQNFKLTECPDSHPIMTGVGIGVTDDSQSGGRAHCCKSKYLEISDCKEESYWEKNTEDYKMAICPTDRPLMKGVGMKVYNDDQAGGKAYCCKTNVELRECAITSYWKDSNKDYKLTYCPEDRQILGGAGFSVQHDNQNGGKAYCCKGRVRLISGQEDEKVEVVEEETPIQVGEEKTEEVEKSIGEESAGRLMVKIICKIFYFKNTEKYRSCIGS